MTLKPNFFLLGSPKCGTTSVMEWLGEHPQVFVPPVKEPFYFAHDRDLGTGSLDDYEALFAGATDEHLAIGEGSTNYLISDVAVGAILAYNPDARFIVCFRNPIAMAQSLHGERLYQGTETETDFSRAWRLQDERRAARSVPRGVDHRMLDYAGYCMSGNLLQKLYERVDSSRVLVLLLDDLNTDPAAEYFKALGFLGIDTSFSPDFQARNTRKDVLSAGLSRSIRYVSQLKRRLGWNRRLGLGVRIRKLNTRAGEAPAELSQELRQELAKYFEDDVRLLGHLVNRELSHWLEI